MKQRDLQRAALQACCVAAVPQDEEQADEATRFDLLGLPADLRRPAAALIYQAIAYRLAAPIGADLHALRWAGLNWTLTDWSGGRLHIASIAGGVGLLSQSVALLRGGQ